MASARCEAIWSEPFYGVSHLKLTHTKGAVRQVSITEAGRCFCASAYPPAGSNQAFTPIWKYETEDLQDAQSAAEGFARSMGALLLGGLA